MISRRSFSLSLACAPLALKGAGAADEGPRGPGVLELFTSQGCSSCPPADALMLELAGSARDIIPLTFPVEVWDYLGWKDTLAKPAFTARQKAYAAMVADRRVFTPQAVANGRVSWVGSDIEAVKRWQARGTNVTGARLDVVPVAEGWRVTAHLAAGSSARLVVLPLVRRRAVKVDRGENKDRSITYANVVRDIRDGGALQNGTVVTLARALTEAPEADAFALLAQLGTLDSPGMILAAAMVEGNAIRA